MLIPTFGNDTAARRSRQKTHLHEIGLIHFLNCARVLLNNRGDRIQAHRSTAEFLDDRAQHLAIKLFQAHMINGKQFIVVAVSGVGGAQLIAYALQ